ncbi:unannotated protein [freshwater metagenome]|uniref:Unannotated protein n=1 Tax=freshwater metagenome TaxID=449393 RepID=A0A6J7BUC9_9ZZZZ
MPSSIAARVAETASSMRCFFSLSSTSVCAPTLITQTPPESFAKRSESFSLSQSESEFSISRLIWPTRSFTAAASPPPSTIVVLSLVATTRRALPRTSRPTWSIFRPMSAEITVAPVRIAMSSRIDLRRSPNAGALIATLGKVPRIRFTTSVESASPSTSSAMITNGLLAAETFSRIGSSSETLEILPWTNMMAGLSNTASMRSASVTK